jgi:hypothetical protein
MTDERMDNPPSSWKITMLLADSAQAIAGKLYILGGGWSVTGPDPVPSGIALKVEIPWEAANRRHTIRVELLDSDGRPAMVPGPEQAQPIFFEAPFEVGRPAGVKPGTPLDWPFAVNFGPMPLAAGRYEWRCTIPEANVTQSCAFTVREPGITVRIPPPE